tara:strand:- start:3675 stop:3812 length:138 start_codon:yes stop_codon:yes gene_type:complete
MATRLEQAIEALEVAYDAARSGKPNHDIALLIDVAWGHAFAALND